MAWTVNLSASAQKQLAKLDASAAKRITRFLRERVQTSDNPRICGKALTGPLGGLWRYRVGDYRIICEINDGVLVILVIGVGNRKEIYR